MSLVLLHQIDGEVEGWDSSMRQGHYLVASSIRAEDRRLRYGRRAFDFRSNDVEERLTTWPEIFAGWRELWMVLFVFSAFYVSYVSLKQIG